MDQSPETFMARLASLPDVVDSLKARVDHLESENKRLRDTHESDFLSLKEAATRLNCSPTTVRRWITEGRLSRNVASRHIRIPRTEIEQFSKDVVI